MTAQWIQKRARGGPGKASKVHGIFQKIKIRAKDV